MGTRTHMTAQEAREALGLTMRVMADSDVYSGEFLVSPHADLDGTIKAYCLVEGDVVRLNGWMWSFDTVEGA